MKFKSLHYILIIFSALMLLFVSCTGEVYPIKKIPDVDNSQAINPSDDEDEKDYTKGLSYEPKRDAEGQIIGYIITEYEYPKDNEEGIVVIPNEFEGYPVIAIGNEIFYQNNKIKKVTLPDSLETIGDRAFACCEMLAEINLPESLKSILGGAFGDCPSLLAITIPEGVIEIGQGVFSGCTGLEYVKLPNNLKSIPNFTFYKCSSLKEINVPEELYTIGNVAFYKTENLSEDIKNDFRTTVTKNGGRFSGAF